MQNLKEGSVENADTKKKAIKRNIAHRYIKYNSKTIHRIVREQSANNEDPTCLLIKVAEDLIEQYGNYSAYRFFEANRSYLPSAEGKMLELSPYCSYVSASNLIEQVGKPASELIKSIEEAQKPILCIDEATANRACMLVCARTLSVLTKKYWRDLPNGDALLFKAEEQFEELCSSLKIGRRTSSIINRNKVKNVA